MYSYLSGKLVKILDSIIVLDVNGIGFEIHVPLRTLPHLPPPGSSVTMHTYFHVREDAHIFYGFSSEEEKELFKILLGVTGIGPKLALSILSGVGPAEFRRCIESRDEKYLAHIPGIGAKTASRLVLELKEKIQKIKIAEGSGQGKDQAMETARDALMALVSLGFSRGQAQGALEEALKGKETEVSLEVLVRNALKTLNSAR